MDNDEFNITQKLLSQECKYIIGNDVIIGPDDISHSYEQNMLDGRKKLDVLEWGQSRIEPINESEYYVHFTDFLMHKGRSYTHKCKQHLLINDEGKITFIKHIHDQEETDRLENYYKEVGLRK